MVRFVCATRYLRCLNGTVQVNRRVRSTAVQDQTTYFLSGDLFYYLISRVGPTNLLNTHDFIIIRGSPREALEALLDGEAGVEVRAFHA